MTEFVDALTPSMCGRWLVTTQGTTHIWDLDAMTYERRPGVESRAGAMAHDGLPHRITRVERWPAVGDISFVWFDDPDMPLSVEQWRQSSTIRSIARLPASEAGSDD